MAFAWIYVGTDRALATAALELGFTTLARDRAAAGRAERGTGHEGSLQGLAKLRMLDLTGDAVYDGPTRIGARATIRNVTDQERALSIASSEKLLLVDASDWKVIPLENLIARCQGKTTLVAEAHSLDDARLFLATLEVGVDGVLFHPHSASELRELASVLAHREGRRDAVTLVPATITTVRSVGTGDRVCLDTASILEPGEGVLVGSQSGGLFLVASETQETGYVAARPFRVNAGAVHAYVLLPDGKTKYLSEVRAGDEILTVRRDGSARRVVLGRVKIERRPLLLIEADVYHAPAGEPAGAAPATSAQVEGARRDRFEALRPAPQPAPRRISTLLQNAETVPLTTPDSMLSVAHAKTGDTVLVRVEEHGRHFGTAVRETITER
ncbi:MAG: 3-dehydroquinate synthase II [Thermoplasmatota archaeon]